MHNLVNELQLVLADVKQVFLKQEHKKLEQVVNKTLSKIQSLENQHAPVLNLILNSRPSELGTIDLLILKQVLISKKLTNKLNYLSDAEVTISKTSLFILYLLLPHLVSLLKQQISLAQFAALTRLTINKAFSLAYKLKIKDKDCLKLLSLLANKNKFSNTNLLAQTLVALNVNTNLLTNIKTTSEYLSVEQALSSQFAMQINWLLPNPNLTNVLQELLVINSSELFAGHLIRCFNKKYYLAFVQTENISNWLCVEFDIETKSFNDQLEEIEQENIAAFYPQSKISLTKVISAVTQTKEEWQAYSEASYGSTLNSQDLNYSVPEFWPKIVKSLISGNTNHLSTNIELEPKLKQILLHYASDINREKLTIRSSKHAISLLGQERVFPILTNGLFTSVQHSHRFIGSEVVNEKVSLLTNISYLVAKDNNTKSLPEFVPMFMQLLTMSLFSVPKVKFSVASNNKPKLNSLLLNSEHISLAEVYQYQNISMWKNITKKLVSVWRLPRYVDVFISKYLSSVLKPNQSTFSSKEQEWLNCIELTLACYLMLENPNLSNDIKKRLTLIAKRYGMSLRQLEELALSYAQQLNYKSVLI